MSTWHPAPNVLADSIDGEVVAIHLLTGRYYSMRGTAAEIWAGLTDGATVDDLGAGLAPRHGAEPAAAGRLAEWFLGRLAADDLVAGPGTDAGETPVVPAVPGIDPPVLESFTDLEELMLLDPVHDVDERGWPHATPPTSRA